MTTTSEIYDIMGSALTPERRETSDETYDLQADCLEQVFRL